MIRASSFGDISRVARQACKALLRSGSSRRRTCGQDGQRVASKPLAKLGPSCSMNALSECRRLAAHLPCGCWLRVSQLLSPRVHNSRHLAEDRSACLPAERNNGFLLREASRRRSNVFVVLCKSSATLPWVNPSVGHGLAAARRGSCLCDSQAEEGEAGTLTDQNQASWALKLRPAGLQDLCCTSRLRSKTSARCNRRRWQERVFPEKSLDAPQHEHPAEWIILCGLQISGRKDSRRLKRKKSLASSVPIWLSTTRR